MKVLVTGAAGFIGSKLMYMLADRGDEVVGIDNLNDYYDVRLKHGRIAEFCTGERKRFIEMDIADKESLDALFAAEGFDAVVNLAAQAG
ncbi:MAG: GDP-mannose 4,6-dehydratase, partial [Candidatus Methanomethylophilaceae archaeon]|nr:GDP-mannose 4,6-dehydratase [Candidatus Methanomethylophilaceae archaeon]